MRSTRAIPLLVFALCSYAASASTEPARANPVDPTVAEPSGAEQAAPAALRDAEAAASFGPPVATASIDPDTAGGTGPHAGDGADVSGSGRDGGRGDSVSKRYERTAPPAEVVDATDTQEDAPASTDPTDVTDAADEPAAAGGIPLGRPSDPQMLGGASRGTGGAGTSTMWALRTAGALAVVIGVIVACRYAMQWLERRAGGASGFSGSVGAPSGVAEVLARYPVSKGTKLLLLKINCRVLVVSQTGEGLRTLSEIVDPDEVASILIKTRDEEGASEASRFTELLREMERDPSVAGESSSGFRSPRRALAELDDADEAEAPRATDGESALRNRLSRLGDLSA